MYMKRIIIILLGVLAVNTTSRAQGRVVHDTKTAKMVGENMGAALAGENLYTAQVDSTEKKRTSLLSKVTIRNIMKSADMLSRKNLGNLTAEGAAYSTICREIKRLMESISKLGKNAAKKPAAFYYCSKQTAEVLLEAEGYVEQAIVIAMNAKVPNPFKDDADNKGQSFWGGGRPINKTTTFEQDELKKSPKDRKTDGLNLLHADDRIRICNQTIYGLRRLRRMVDVISFKLKCNYTWKDAMAKTLGYEYYWAMGMAYEVERTKNSIKNAPWW